MSGPQNNPIENGTTPDTTSNGGGVSEAVGFITEFNANVVLFEQIAAQLLANTSPDALSDGENTLSDLFPLFGQVEGLQSRVGILQGQVNGNDEKIDLQRLYLNRLTIRVNNLEPDPNERRPYDPNDPRE